MSDLDVTSDVSDGACTLAECTVADGGSCARGEPDPLDCKFFELASPDDIAQYEPEIRTIALPSGEALFADEMEPLFASHPVSLVAPLGLNEAGKTTLIAMIYLFLRSGRLDGFRFAGSRTVVGLARRTHDASVASARNIGTTPRTGRETSGQHLHLAMRRTADDSPAPLVLADLAGEHVRELQNGACPDVVCATLRRADHIPIVVDGVGVADPTTRSATILSTRTLIGMLAKQDRNPAAELSVVLTKADMLGAVDTDAVLDAICRDTIAATAARFVTADREPPDSHEADRAIEFGTGVLQLVNHIAGVDPGLRADPSDRERRLTVEPSPLLKRLWRKDG